MKFTQSELQDLIDKQDYDGAKAYCRAALAAGEPWRFWLTQLGYVCFEHFRDSISYYVQAPSIFETLVASDPMG